MNLYRKTHDPFFLTCAKHRMEHFLIVLSKEHLERNMWATEKEIEDFTLAYMQGGEL